MALQQLQYGAIVYDGHNTAPVMPSAVRERLDADLDAILAKVDGNPVERDYVWLPAGNGLEAVGGAKTIVTREVDETAYKAGLAAEGWAPYQSMECSPRELDLMDVWLDGKVERWARPHEASA